MKKLFSALLGFSLTGAALLMAQQDPPKKERPKMIIADSVKVTDIKDNLVTVKDDIGTTRTLELVSVEGIKIGTKAICEEDCGKGLKIGEKVFRIQKVIK